MSKRLRLRLPLVLVVVATIGFSAGSAPASPPMPVGGSYVYTDSWFESFRSAGGRGELVVIPPFPERVGHGVFPSTRGIPLWTSAVSRFFATYGLALSFPG